MNGESTSVPEAAEIQLRHKTLAKHDRITRELKADTAD
jgi:hypothetical protein